MVLVDSVALFSSHDCVRSCKSHSVVKRFQMSVFGTLIRCYSLNMEYLTLLPTVYSCSAFFICLRFFNGWKKSNGEATVRGERLPFAAQSTAYSRQLLIDPVHLSELCLTSRLKQVIGFFNFRSSSVFPYLLVIYLVYS